MLTLATTRFNTRTWQEYQEWLLKYEWEGCIYGTPIPVKEGLKPLMIVLEMHNDENKVKAIGLIKNQIIYDKTYYRLFKDRNYSRYVYRGRYRLLLDRIELNPLEKKIIAIFNQLLFKGACHFKRAQGITEVPDWIMNNNIIDFLKYFKALFRRYYPGLVI